jgi:hypothetical protein
MLTNDTGIDTTYGALSTAASELSSMDMTQGSPHRSLHIPNSSNTMASILLLWASWAPATTPVKLLAVY